MKKLLNRKEALGMIDAIFTSLHFNLISIKDLGIENSKERDYFLTEAWKIDQGRLKKDYEQTVNSLDAIGFNEYYKLIGKFATKYKIGCWKEYNEYEPILIEELNEELRKYDKTADKLELINSFTVDELQSESFIFDSKVQVLYDILDDFNVGNNKEEGINTVLESFNSSDKASFIGKLQTDKNLLNALIDKVNGTQKDEMLALMGEMFIQTGFVKEGTHINLDNGPKDKYEAIYENGKVYITVSTEQPGGIRDYRMIKKSEYYVDALETVTLNYDNRQIIVRFPWQSDDESYDPTAAIKELGETALLTFYKGTDNFRFVYFSYNFAFFEKYGATVSACNTYICILCFARSVYNTAHNGDFNFFFHIGYTIGNFVRDFYYVYFGSSAGGAGYYFGIAL